jgi:hypothetical protein
MAASSHLYHRVILFRYPRDVYWWCHLTRSSSEGDLREGRGPVYEGQMIHQAGFGVPAKRRRQVPRIGCIQRRPSGATRRFAQEGHYLHSAGGHMRGWPLLFSDTVALVSASSIGDFRRRTDD